MKNNMLEVGDIIIAEGLTTITSKYVIDQVTDTQAISNKTKFKRTTYTFSTIDKIHVRTIPHNIWDTTSYYLLTPEIEEEIKERIIKQNLQFKCRKLLEQIRIDKYETCEIEAILKCIEPIVERYKIMRL